MKKIDLFYGLIIGLTASLIGIYMFIIAFTPYSFLGGLQLLKYEGKLGKIVTLGILLNIGMFFGLLKYKKETIAKGIILGVILLSIINLFI
jgi:DNA-binding transcriptional regulator of glucitol operon